MIYTSDREIPETVWNNYMRVFDNKYKVFKDTAGIYYLSCKYGSIQLHSMLRHQLAAVLTFKSLQGVNKTIKALKELAPGSYVSQNGDNDVVIVFNEVDLDEVAGYLRVRYKRQYTPEQKQKLMERFYKKAMETSPTERKEG